MATLVNIEQKLPGGQVEATEFNQQNQAINIAYNAAIEPSHVFSGEDFIVDGVAVVDGKTYPLIRFNQALLDGLGSTETGASILQKLSTYNQPIPDVLLPARYFSGLTGSGLTPQDPFVFPQSQVQATDVAAYLQSLPGYAADKALYSDLTWRTITGGSAGSAPSGGAVIPPAPTNPVINDSADTFSVTPPAGYTTAQLETSVNSGTTWADNPNLNGAFYIGDFAKSIGQVITRVKASGSYSAGYGVSNQTAFTVASAGPALTAATASFWETVDSNWVFNSNTVTYNGPDDYSTIYGGSKFKIPAGAAFTLQMASGVNESGRLAVVTSEQGSVNSSTAAVFYGGTATNGRFSGVIGGNGRDSYSSVSFTNPLLGRIRGTGTTIYLEQSKDSGTTWQLITSDSTLVQPNVDLFVEGLNIMSGGVSNYLKDVKYTGLVAV